MASPEFRNIVEQQGRGTDALPGGPAQAKARRSARSQIIPRVLVGVPLTGVYFVAGKLGLKLAFVHASATAVWPPTGIALAAFLVLGYWTWPSILAGAFLVNLTTAGSVATSLSLGVGNTLEGLLGAYLVNRFARGHKTFDQARDVFKFAALAAVLSTTVSATCGVTSLSLGGFAEWSRYGSIWLTWWLGDATGALIVAPLVILWAQRPLPRWGWARLLEAVGLFVSLGLVGEAVFGGSFLFATKDYPLEFLCIPILVWVAFRFSPREAATAVFILSGISIWWTLHGFGPFVRASQNESLLLLQAFMGVSAVTTLALAAVVGERRGAEEQLRELVVTDPVTGLANYRRLMEKLQEEIQRSQRTERPFGILLLDMDGLKRINDLHGHLVGTRSLCRLADVLRLQCRVVDTAARYGGDEFALLLVDSGMEAVQQVARRIAERLAIDREEPVLSVSAGAAIYPADGDTPAKLLEAADRALYAMKSRGGGKLPLLR